MPTADTFCMNLHLAEISQTVDADVQVALVLDGAGWHSSQALRVPDNITLIPLPPYSPELNPMELVWLYLKSHYLANRVYADHHALYEAGIDAWNRFADDPDRISSVYHAAWTETAQLNWKWYQLACFGHQPANDSADPIRLEPSQAGVYSLPRAVTVSDVSEGVV